MTMEKFNIKRFGAYLASDAASVWSKCWISLLVIIAMPAAVYLVNGLFLVLFGEAWAGQSLEPRFVLFVCMCLVACVAFPAKIYGHVTDRRFGPDFTLLPVSSLEKTLSMLIFSCIAVPLVTIVGYGLVDALICALDPSCGYPVLAMPFNVHVSGSFTGPEELRSAMAAFINPLLYIDDVIQTSLVFLLGALCFKKSKVAKTVLALICFSIVTGMLLSAIFKVIGLDALISADIEILFWKFNSIFKNLALIDTVIDTVTNLLLAAAIYFRVKTIKY